MPVRIRLARFGYKHHPFYRIRVVDSRSPRDGNFIEQLGTYDPLVDINGNKILRLNTERVKYWLGVGAQTSDTVARLFSKFNLLPLPAKRSILKFDTQTIQQLQKQQHAAPGTADTSADDDKMTTYTSNAHRGAELQKRAQEMYKMTQQFNAATLSPETYVHDELTWMKKVRVDKQKHVEKMQADIRAEEGRVQAEQASRQALSQSILDDVLNAGSDNPKSAAIADTASDSQPNSSDKPASDSKT